jgi:hypothetical protein
MGNNRFTQEQFNELFFSKVSMTYLFMNLVLILIGLVASDFILLAHPPKVNNDFDNNELQPLEDDTPISDDSQITEDRKDRDGEEIHRRGLGSLGKQEAYLGTIEDIRLAEGGYTVFSNPRWKLLPLLIFPYTACFSTSLVMTFCRCLSGMALSDSEESQLSGMMPKVYLCLIVLCSVYSYYLLNKALKHFNTVYVVPLFKAGDLFHNLLSGGVFLREFGEYTHFELFMFLSGIAICILSISLLLAGNDQQNTKPIR